MTPYDSALPAPSTPHPSRAKILRWGTSLGAMSMLLAAAPALAEPLSACGTPVEGVVNCSSENAPFPGGIAYSVDAPLPQDLTLVLPAGTAVSTAGDEVSGISITSSGGAITVAAAGSGLDTAGSRAAGIQVSGWDGDIKVEAGNVTTTGYRSDGIAVDAGMSGNIAINAESVLTMGEASTGIRANTGDGDIAVHTGGVYSYGLGSDAIHAETASGNVNIDTKYAYASGGSGRGIVAYSSGTTTVHANVVGTSGGGYGTEDDATGVTAVGTAVNVQIADTVRTSGDNATGIFARTNLVYSDPTIVPDITISADHVVTNGMYSHGVVALNYADAATTHVAVGDVSTRGDGSFGIYAGGYGNVVVDADTVITTGTGSEAIHAVTFSGDIAVNAGTVSTGGQGAHGIYAINYSNGTVSVGADAVKTRRDGAIGIGALSLGDVKVDAGSIETSGFGSQGIVAYSVYGKVDVTAGTVSTTGGNATGIGAYVFGEGQTAHVAAGSVDTRGDYAVGILAQAAAGAVNVSSTGTVSTSGEHSDGIVAMGLSLDGTPAVTVTAGTVITTGGGARGIAVQGGLGDVSVTVDKVVTSGDIGGGRHSTFAEGILANTTEGTVAIKAGSVETFGRGAVGIDASASFGAIDIDVDSIATTGYRAPAILSAAWDSSTSIKAGSVTTSGDYAAGIQALSFQLDPYFDTDRSIAIKADSIKTTGGYSDGVYAVGTSGITVSAGSVATSGVGASGIYAASLYGDIDINGGNVSTQGDHASGIFALAQYGSAVVNADSVTTKGERSDGIRAGGLSSSVTVNAIKLEGYGSTGIDSLAAYGNAAVHAGSIEGSGDAQTAVLARAFGGDVSIEVDKIAMAGYGSAGIMASSEQGGISIAANTVTVGNGGAAVGAAAYQGDASVKIGTVVSGGSGITATAGRGNVVVEAGPITTTGEFGKAVYTNANGGQSSVTLSGNVTTSGVLGFGVQATTVGGDNLIENQKVVRTTGRYAYGIIGNSFVGNVRISGGSVSTSGYHAGGIVATAVGPYSSATVHADTVLTSGDKADGIFAQSPLDVSIPFLVPPSLAALKVPDAPGAGADDHWVSIAAGTVKVSGAGSNAIRARAAGSLAIDVTNASAADGRAILAEAYGNAAVTVRGAVSSQTEAINLKAENAAITIAKGGSVSGGVDALVLSAVGPYVPPPSEAEEGGGIGIGFAVASVPQVTITNAGTIQGGTGFAVRIDNGTANITNSGTISGRIRFGGGDDLITNTGTFVASGDSDFGAGSDRFVNSGAVKVLAGAAKAGTVSFLGLERFENAGGTIDMVNGHAGDRLVLSGDYFGSGKAKIALEVGNGLSDHLTVQGAATGSTAIVLTDLDNTKAVLTGSKVLALVDVGAGSAANAFTLDESNFGFVHYDLDYDAASKQYQLSSAAGAPVYRLAKLNETIANTWNKGVATITSHFASLRDGPALGGKRLWGTFAGDVSRTRQTRGYQSPASSGDPMQVGYNQNDVEARLGYDIGDIHDTAAPIFGATAGYVSSTINFAESAARVSVDSFDVAVYGRYNRGALFVNGLVDAEFHHLKAADRGLGYRDGFSGTTFGGSLEGGAHLTTGRYFIEPSAQLAWSQSSLGDLKVLNQEVSFANGHSLRGTFGARFGGSNGNATFYGGLHYLHEFAGKSGATLLSAGVDEALGNRALGDRARGTLGVNIAGSRGLSGFVEANGEVGSGRRGGGGRAGVRFSF